MNGYNRLKKIYAFAAAIVLTVGIGGSSLTNSLHSSAYDITAPADTQAVADTTAVTQSEQSENSQVADGTSTLSSDSNTTSSTEGNNGFDITKYATQLKKLNEQQEKLNKQIDDNSSSIQKEEAQQKLLLKKIDSVNDEIKILEEYLTALEIQIHSNERKIDTKKQEIETATDNFKKRLRAMYLSGSDSYTMMLLKADNFYDILMRIELIKRVASHDNSLIDNLVKLKAEYEETQAKLSNQKADYENRKQQYSTQKKTLNKLYDSSVEAKKKLEDEKKKLEQQNKEYEEEKSAFEGSMSGILKSSSTTGTARDKEVAATMELADVKLDELHKAVAKKIKSGKKLGKYEPDYYFAWPVPGLYSVSSGVGARWGAYHTGIDIPGARGTAIHASECGTVVSTNTSCTHNYGKTKSCGCGGGYGNYVIIDHGNGFVTLYGHMTKVEVTVGQKVKSGEEIGKMGSTGFSTGDHLHFEIRYNGYIVNPAYYVDVTK